MVSNNNGFSLLELMIVAGITSVLSLGVAGLMSNMSRESRGMAEKLGSMNVEHNVTTFIAKDSNCTDQIAPTNLKTPGSTSGIPESVTPSTARHIPLKTVNGLFPAISPGTSPDPTVGSLKVLSDSGTSHGVELIVNDYNSGASTASGSLNIYYDQSKLVRPIHNVSIPVTLQTLPNGANKFKIKGCEGLQSADTLCTQMGYTWDGTKCVPDPIATCVALGGNWTGTACQLAPAPPTPASCVASGGTWNGSSCDPAISDKIKCLSQGGTTVENFYDPAGQCNAVGSQSCQMAPGGCNLDKTKLFIGACAGGLCSTACSWTCK